MIYEVRIRLFFDSEDEARDFYHDGEMAWPKSIPLNPDTPAQEPRSIELIENHHDEDPNAPCVVIEHMIDTPLIP